MSDFEFNEETMSSADGGATVTEASPEVIRYKATREETEEHLAFLQRGVAWVYGIFLIVAQLFWLIPWIAYGTFDPTAELIVSAALIIFRISLRDTRKKQAIKREKKYPDAYSEYTVYDGYLEYRDYDKDGNVITFYRVGREEVEMAAATPTLYVFRKDGISFSVRRDLVPEGSRYFDVVFPKGVPDAKGAAKKRGRMALPKSADPYVRILTIVCAVVTLCSILLDDAYGAHFWIPFALLALPIGLMALVLHTAYRREKVRILPIVTFLLCGAILFFQGFVGAITYTDTVDADEIAPYFETLGLPMLSFEQTYCYESTVFDNETRTFLSTETYYVYLEEEEIPLYYEHIKEDTRWQSDTECDLYDAYAAYAEYLGDLYLIYNVTEGTVNAIPSESECEYVIFSFASSYPTIYLVRFTK